MKSENLKTARNYMRRTLNYTMLFCALVASSFPLATNAQEFSFDKVNPDIRYLGAIQDKLIFQIDLQSKSTDLMYVSIKDEDGTVLFTEKIRDNQFSRKFAFDKNEFEGKKLSFIIHEANESKAQTFQVARQMRMVEDVVITRL